MLPGEATWESRDSDAEMAAASSLIYAAKAVAFAAVARVASLVTAFTAFFLGQALLASKHQSATLADPRVLRSVLGPDLRGCSVKTRGRSVSWSETRSGS